MLNQVMEGKIYPAPKYGNKGGKDSGCVDMVPDDWDIELLYDGRRLYEHVGLFEPAAPYGKWETTGEMADYVLIGFTLKRPDPTGILKRY